MQKNAGSPSVSNSMSGVKALAGELRAQRIRALCEARATHLHRARPGDYQDPLLDVVIDALS